MFGPGELGRDSHSPGGAESAAGCVELLCCEVNALEGWVQPPSPKTDEVSHDLARSLASLPRLCSLLCSSTRSMAQVLGFDVWDCSFACLCSSGFKRYMS